MKCISNDLKRKLKQKLGDAKLTYGLLAVGMICLMTLLLMELMNGITTVRTVRDALDHAALSVAAENAPGAFGGIREGNGSVWAYDDGTAPAMNYSDVVTALDLERKLLEESGLGLTRDGGTLARYDDRGQLVYRISSLSVSCENSPLAGESGSSCTFKASCRLYLPMYFLKLDLGPTMDVIVSSRFLPRF